MDLHEKLMTMPYGLALAVKNIVDAAEQNGISAATTELIREAGNLLEAEIKRRNKFLSEKDKGKATTAQPKAAKPPKVAPKVEAVVEADEDDDSPEMEKVNGKWRVKEPAAAAPTKTAKTKAKPATKAAPVEDLDLDEEDDDLPEIDLDEDEDDETAGIDT